MPPVTASQTIGPFWHLLGESGNDDLTRFAAARTEPAVVVDHGPLGQLLELVVRQALEHVHRGT